MAEVERGVKVNMTALVASLEERRESAAPVALRREVLATERALKSLPDWSDTSWLSPRYDTRASLVNRLDAVQRRVIERASGDYLRPDPEPTVLDIAADAARRSAEDARKLGERASETVKAAAFPVTALILLAVVLLVVLKAR